MESIIQKDKAKCFICKQNPCGDPLDKHHVFGSACRSKSEKYGLTVYIHHNKCHIFGENAVHVNAETNHALQAFAQKKAMKHYGWSVDDFRKEFYKNYLEEDET
jgi:hypothetical protein